MQKNLKMKGWGDSSTCSLKIFEDFAQQYERCPLCNFNNDPKGRYLIDDNKVLRQNEISVNLTCPYCQILHLNFTNTHTFVKGKRYNNKEAKFHLYLKEYHIYYTTKYSSSVLIRFNNIRNSIPLPSNINIFNLASSIEEPKTIRLPFNSLDSWFVPISQIKKRLGKYLILM